MKHRLFLFDLADTLLDFRASEQASFQRTMAHLDLRDGLDALFAQYQATNIALWRLFEQGAVTKDFLRIERFRKTFADNRIDVDPHVASDVFSEALADTVVLIDGAVQLCELLAGIGEVGIITNGAHSVQHRRIASSGLAPSLSFVATSEACGFAKPDSRFFDYTSKMARSFTKLDTVIVGDRLDADILGANRFGIDSCWFNPGGLANESQAIPTCEVDSLHGVDASLRRLALA